jgi:hypothetical protein
MEAAWRGEQANICRARYLHGTLRRRSDKHKHEGHAHYPVRPIGLPGATETVRCWDGAMGASRRQCSHLTKWRRAESAASGKVAVSPSGLDSRPGRELAREQ